MIISTEPSFISSIPLMPGIRAEFLTSQRIRTRVLFSGSPEGEPVLFLHGNLSSATWWEETMLRLPQKFRAIAPDQRGFGQSDGVAKIDATRGMGDLADDAVALLDFLGIRRAHVVGNSLGGSVVWHLMASVPERFASATLVAPGSPYGFSGTKDASGTRCYPDFAGSGAGLINLGLVGRIGQGDRSLDGPLSPRNALRALVFRPPFVPDREEEILSSMLEVHLGERDLPGDAAASPCWPGVGPGIWGATNALSPKYALDPAELIAAERKIDVLWIRGADDLAVAEEGSSDPGTLGRLGVLKGWPGMDEFPPQPMLQQTRRVLEQYAVHGGAYREIVIEAAGHVPFIETPRAFDQPFHQFLFEHSIAKDTA